MKFNKKGEFLTSWGHEEDEESDYFGPYELNVPHQLTLLQNYDEICVADREHFRVVCYDTGAKNSSTTGLFRREIDTSAYGMPYGVAVVPQKDAIAILVNKPSKEYGLTSSVIVYSLKNENIEREIKNIAEKGFGHAHALSVDSEGKRLLIAGLEKVCPGDMDELCDRENVNNVFVPRNVWLFL